MARSLLTLCIVLQLVACIVTGAEGVTFTFINHCKFTVWVGVQPNGGLPLLVGGGFELAAGKQDAVTASASWGGRFWGRTGCKFDSAGKGNCETGDCGGVLKCGGAGGNPPASLAEITLNGADGNDFYDISLVDGYNLPLSMAPSGGTGKCGAPGCISNLNDNCPAALQFLAEGVLVGCNSACNAFNTPEYCCTGAFGGPTTCPPTQYSMAFKSACPTAYSYAYDDATSTFTCKGANYAITFCPTVTPVAKVTSNTTTPSLPNGVPGSPGIDQYGTGTGAGNRHSAHVVYILLLSIAAFFALLG
ncbi:pathogenesis-related thaumatin-like protein 3.5 isoform X1 [Physcomitrium patens]|uniref:Thaumatin-like protein n=1 Tax=Physcomitrium patens TaxID=3218 RepID=A0A2K1J8Z3_PHYPA|nr:thaumatin-like protein isoform X1 [Physcomitrium patens]PNR38010.1 hypothetical protein PHYPA_021121 [Physcomitrium patens]|eukprot:XP_024397992.1 thaumatin-like protein isoform X1 [Physcomitrella patens]